MYLNKRTLNADKLCRTKLKKCWCKKVRSAQIKRQLSAEVKRIKIRRNPQKESACWIYITLLFPECKLDGQAASSYRL